MMRRELDSSHHVKVQEHRSFQILANGAFDANPRPLSMFTMSEAVVQASAEELATEALRKDMGEAEEITKCDRDFHVMPEGSDTCTVGEQSWFREDCILAAGLLGYNMSDHYMLDTHYENPLPYPKACFLNTSETPMKISFNPSASDASNITLMGKKICMRMLYVNGTENTDADAACSGAGPDYVPILEYDACKNAMTCHSGPRAPKLVAFETKNTTYRPTDKPKGCFIQISTGEWGFNWAHKNGVEVDQSKFADVASICHDSAANSFVLDKSTAGF